MNISEGNQTSSKRLAEILTKEMKRVNKEKLEKYGLISSGIHQISPINVKVEQYSKNSKHDLTQEKRENPKVVRNLFKEKLQLQMLKKQY
jgi:hypothetical protein